MLSVLFWAVIPAAFIGPGTVTTCALAGHEFGPRLLFALTFSVFACFTLQEAVARLASVSDLTVGAALRRLLPRGRVPLAVIVAVVLGCAAYEAGNILGAVEGLVLVVDPGRSAGAAVASASEGAVGPDLLRVGLALGVFGAALGLLFLGDMRRVARVLGILVAGMGVAFLACAVLLRPDPAAWLRGAVVPRIPREPAHALPRLLALVGTTVVPYNLFLGSRLARRTGGERDGIAGEFRFGLLVAIAIGGLISAAIVVVGSAVEGAFDFAALAAVIERRLGGFARPLFAFGLFAAGFTSAITAPLAAALAVDGTWPARERPEATWRYRLTWLLVLGFGATVAALGARPIPVILLAQAANGVLLPFVALLVLVLVNDRRLLPAHERNGWRGNLALGVVCAATLVLGGVSVWNAVRAALGA